MLLFEPLSCAVAAHALHSVARRPSCPRMKVWLRRSRHVLAEALVDELAEVVLDGLVNQLQHHVIAFVVLVLVIRVLAMIKDPEAY